MKNLMTYVTAFIALSLPTFAATPGAVLDSDSGKLHVSVLGDNCNTYKQNIEIKTSCINTGLSRECTPKSHIKIAIYPRTRKACSREEVKIFSFDFTDESFNLDDYSLTVNEEKISITPIIAYEKEQELYQCLKETKANSRCRKLGGCISTFMSLYNEQGTLIKEFRTGSLENKSLECNELKRELISQ
jgi:hypothetical protein